MNANDPQAGNILSRLFSYTPRPARSAALHKPRSALEDFCTEALAWCLGNSQPFRAGFFKLINEGLKQRGKKPLPLDTPETAPVINTQLHFRGDDDDAGPNSGRFDLVIQSTPLEEFLLVVEAKVESGYGDGQIAKYSRELDGDDSFPESKRKILVTLVKHDRIEIPDKEREKLDAVLYWRDVQKLLEETSRSEPASAASFVLNQIAEFLKSRGMYFMKLPEINSKRPVEGVEFCYSISKLLAEVRNASEGLSGILKTTPSWREDGGGLYMAIENKGGQYFSIGFNLRQPYDLYAQAWWIKGKVSISQIQKESWGKQNMDFYDWPQGFGFSGAFENEMNGKAEKLRAWFERAADLVLEIRNGSYKDTASAQQRSPRITH